MTVNARPPAGTPNGYSAVVSDGFIVWGLLSVGVPTVIASDETYIVPDNRQVLYAVTIDNEGTITIGENSYLVFVD